MTESDFEIEYLDEDEDVVQQCVQAPMQVEAPVPTALSAVPAAQLVEKPVQPYASSTSLLVERPGRAKKKKTREDEDSDYDPKDDFEYEPSRKTKKRIATSTPRHTPASDIRRVRQVTMTKKEELKYRKDLGVTIPNFEDPLCLPVKSILKDESDTRKLNNWNNLCLNNLKNFDTCLKPDVGETVGSQRSVVLRNVKNKLTGKNETTVWSKLTVISTSDKKTEVFQSVLPKYREAKILEFPLAVTKKAKPVRNTETVLLTKEDDKGEVMIVYKPTQALSAVYKLVDEKSENSTDIMKKDEDKKQYLQELTVCKLCAPCYQSSWRGFKKQTKKKSVVCPICARTFVSVYNLLAHVKTHSPSDVRGYKRLLNRTLSRVVDYHYRCRICQEKCPSIKDLRKHVLTHQSTEQFQCEVCNRVVKNAYSI